MFSERTQVLLSREQVSRLKRIAATDGRSVGAVIREAVDAYTTTADQRRQALERLFALDAPVADWDQMKREIVEGRFGPSTEPPG